MNHACPRLCIAGTGSGVGKTSLTLGLVRALTRRGKRVQTFKVGPDFLDPTYLALASSRPCYNLDGWMTSQPYVRYLFDRATRDADMAVIEGVMGLFDGASPSSPEGSTAEIAGWLKTPVLLVVNAHGVGRSVAAMVKGYAEFDPAVRVAGVIANRSGSDRHKRWMADALETSGLPPLVGSVPRDALPTLSSRHLGLISADRENLTPATLDQLADACERFLDLDGLIRLAESLPPPSVEPSAPLFALAHHSPAHPVRIGIAHDEAFHFYYPDNFDLLEEYGAELVEFSPLRDRALPGQLAGLYLGGGYPELHAEQLSANSDMLESIRSFAAGGHGVYAECGGLMYLGRSLTTVEGKALPLAGVLPIETAMLKQRKALGYVAATPATDSLLAPARARDPVLLRGHEFHYSTIVTDESAASGWRPAYQISRRGRQTLEPEGFCKGSVFASYVHVHFASCPGAAEHFVMRCRPGLPALSAVEGCPGAPSSGGAAASLPADGEAAVPPRLIGAKSHRKAHPSAPGKRL